ncbi:hypothetical protein CRG98_035372 [Punica granatum]|uniref:Uncharacterized protein n=1 Tax=Punica granatum TaxID=22663 RepID=A0A2I0IJV6_PUNGR|nr:hypothetical protein CRG98_035372 [Punica granatum]
MTWNIEPRVILDQAGYKIKPYGSIKRVPLNHRIGYKIKHVRAPRLTEGGIGGFNLGEVQLGELAGGEVIAGERELDVSNCGFLDHQVSIIRIIQLMRTTHWRRELRDSIWERYKSISWREVRSLRENAAGCL